MTVPSYDDLTPGIPDEVDARSVSQLTLFLKNSPIPTPNSQEVRCDPSVEPKGLGSWQLGAGRCQPLYACLRAESSAETLAEVARDFSPRIMRVSASDVLLDVSGLGRLIGEPPAIAKELARALDAAGVEARVAIAPTQTVARLLAASPGSEDPGLRVAGFFDFGISDLPVSLLQPLETLPPAMNHRDRMRPYETLARWGIAMLGDLAALPVAALSSRLGRRGVALHGLARGLDPKPFVPDEDTPRFIGRLELEWPIEALEPLSFVFARLLEPLSASLERADRGAAAIRLDLRLTDRSTHARVLQLPAPMRDARVLRTLLLLDLESHSPSAAIDIVAIELDPAPARITQFSLLQRALPSPETLSTLTARLSALVGESRVGSPALIDTHEPGAFHMQPFTPESTPVGPTIPPSPGATAGAPKRSVEAARSGVPEVSAALRRQRHPPAIRVSVEHGRPVYLAASRRGMPQGAVVQAAGPWRASGGWWTGPVAPPVPPKPACAGEGGKPRSGEGGWDRDEWDVALSSGVVCRIFQDRATQRWFLEGIYD